MGRLDGKVAIVTGAGRGIGAAIAIRLADEGAAVVAAQRTLADGQETVSQIAERGGDAIAVELDVRDEASVQDLMRVTEERYGGLDVLCNNAGVGLIRNVVETSGDEYDYVMDTNVRGVFNCMKHGIPLLGARGGGSVVNVASVASYVGFPNDAAYCTSKGAVLMLTRQAALDYAQQQVRVNAVCPGFIDTPMLHVYCNAQADPEAAMAEVVAMHPMGRLGTPDDVAGATAYLASDDARWVTGASIAVDGGLLCHC
jgi:NAD(P)-dependent dehydrogenase (short-subunit alcohol dehydrogenase family)